MKTAIHASTMWFLLFAVLPPVAGCGLGVDEIVKAFASTRYWERMETTNAIDVLVAADTNAETVATCRLLKAALLLELSEVEFNDDAYAETTNLCALVADAYAGHDESWCLHGAWLLQMQAFAQNEQYANVLDVATNAIPTASQMKIGSSTNAWVALFGSDIPTRVSLEQAYRVNAAESALLLNKNADIFAHTNGLPLHLQEVVREVSDSQ